MAWPEPADTAATVIAKYERHRQYRQGLEAAIRNDLLASGVAQAAIPAFLGLLLPSIDTVTMRLAECDEVVEFCRAAVADLGA